MSKKKTDEERIFEKISPCPNTGCWFWTGADKGRGREYGQVWFRGRNTCAHRAVYITLVGEIPDGLELDHLCRVKSCVNPDHLDPCTHAENIERRDRALAKCGMPDRHWDQSRCKHGHEFTDENTKTSSNGKKLCRMCCKISSRRKYERKKQRLEKLLQGEQSP